MRLKQRKHARIARGRLHLQREFTKAAFFLTVIIHNTIYFMPCIWCAASVHCNKVGELLYKFRCTSAAVYAAFLVRLTRCTLMPNVLRVDGTNTSHNSKL